MPAGCSCLLGCTRCITGLSETANYVIYLVSHEWEEWVQNDQARLPIPGHKMLFRQGDQEMLCRVVKVTKGADHPNNSKYTSHPELALYTIRCPPDKTDLKPGEIMKVHRCPRNYLRFRRRKFPRSWAVWLVDHLNLVEGGVAEVSFRRTLMRKKLLELSMSTPGGDKDGKDGFLRKVKINNNSKFVFVPKPW